MLRLHYVPGGHGNPGSPKRSTPWEFGHLCLCVQVVLGLDKSSHGLIRSITVSVAGRVLRDCRVPTALRRTTVWSAVYHGCRVLPRLPWIRACRAKPWQNVSKRDKRATSIEALNATERNTPWRTVVCRGIVLLRPITFCHVLMRSIPFYYGLLSF